MTPRPDRTHLIAYAAMLVGLALWCAIFESAGMAGCIAVIGLGGLAASALAHALGADQ